MHRCPSLAASPRVHNPTWRPELRGNPSRLANRAKEVRAPVSQRRPTKPAQTGSSSATKRPGARAAGLQLRDYEPSQAPGVRSPPKATLGDIERAIREVPMPPLKLHIQPGGRTLVNVDTIFYTDPTHLRRTVDAARAQRAARRAARSGSPGSTATARQASTSRPGRPYPAKDVTHQYQQPGDDLRARVDTTYRVRYSVDGGGWADLGETLTAPGPDHRARRRRGRARPHPLTRSHDHRPVQQWPDAHRQSHRRPRGQHPAREVDQRRPRGIRDRGGQDRVHESRWERQGPHRRQDGRRRREVGRPEARRHDHRADVRQHRCRARARRPAARLPLHLRVPRQGQPRQAEHPPRLRRRGRGLPHRRAARPPRQLLRRLRPARP